jgi:hypothetical protein
MRAAQELIERGEAWRQQMEVLVSGRGSLKKVGGSCQDRRQAIIASGTS